MILQLDSTSHFDTTMDELRRNSFPGVYAGTSRDDFDDRSVYVRLLSGDELVAYGRLTPGPQAVFETWSKGAAEIPTGPHIIDLGRCLVKEGWRGKDLILLLCIEATQLAIAAGFEQIVGAVIPHRRLAKRLLSIGYKASGPIVAEYESNGNAVLVQPLVATPSPSLTNLLIQCRDSIKMGLAQVGIHYNDVPLDPAILRGKALACAQMP